VSTNTGPVVNGITLVLLIYIVMWNARSYKFVLFEKVFPRSINGIAYFLRLDQKWNMFSPYPLRFDGWYVIEGHLVDGSVVDLFNDGKPISWEKPWVSSTYKNHRWRRYMMNLWKKQYASQRKYYGKYLTRKWNSAHKGDQELETFKLYFMREYTVLDRPPLVKKVLIWIHYANDEAKKKWLPIHKNDLEKIEPGGR